MKEKRSYIVSTMTIDREPYMLNLFNIVNMSDEDFIEEAEGQGWVWSSMLSFAEDWNGNVSHLPNPNESVMRIL